MRELITKAVSDAVLNTIGQGDKASIFEGNTQQPFAIQKLTLDLSSDVLRTNPKIIGFPFKSLYVSAATDVLANVSMVPTAIDSYQSEIPFKLNDSWSSEHPISKGYLYWSAQAGKTMTIHFFVNSEFRSGSQVSQTGGGVAIIDGSSFTSARVTLTAATATALLAVDTTRKQAQVQNNTGSDIWLGGSSVSNTGANLGIRVSTGSTFIWKNTAALYGFSVAGGSGDNGALILSEF